MIRLRVMCLFLQCDQMGIMAVVIKLLPSFLCWTNYDANGSDHDVVTIETVVIVMTVLRRFENGGISDGCGDVDDDKRCYGNYDDDDDDDDDADNKLKNCRQ